MTYDTAFWSRFQFAFTIIYHYLFPQLTMGWRGLSSILVAISGPVTKYNRAARFWTKIFD